MKKLFFLLAAFCCATALHAQTEITTVEFSLNRNAIDFYIGNTEGAVQQKIRENTSVPAEVGYECNNRYLIYEKYPGIFGVLVMAKKPSPELKRMLCDLILVY